ncbi:MAG: fructose-bisphosphatase class III, partial [Firmicutes bacterium]|nr:fructose-bisphosphatase class III [Bacillota bacterium]
MDEELKYMKRLSFDYPNVDAAVRQIVSMRSLLKLPKGTEYFFSDLHGENEAFIHLLRSGSGYIREKVNSFLGDEVSDEKKNELVELIYYPVRALSRHHSAYGNDEDWMIEVIHYLVLICREVSSKYSHRRLIHTMPKTYETILNELIFLDNQDANKAAYYEEMIASSVREGIGDQLITDLCILIRRIIVDHLHIIGDIFDRGPRADKILDELMNYRHVDVQWGNHDITWIGAAHGSPICVASVVRISLSYNGFDVLEDGYGINLRPLSTFAGETYGDDPCDCFRIHQLDQNRYDPVGPSQASKMHKAIAVILLKLEGQLIQRRKEYLMSERLLLDKIDWKTGTVELGESDYRLKDTNFPTIDPDDPYRLSKKEQEVLDALISSFKHSEKLQRHIGFLVDHGGLYSRYNGNLLYHGCIPMDADGNFLKVKIKRKDGVTVIVSGKELMDELDRMIRQSLYSQNKEDLDILWYLWAGPKSPLYGKAKMATFER